MLNYPQIDPVAFSSGPLTVHWYGVMYIVAFSACWYLARLRAAAASAGRPAVWGKSI
jgi:phosphatidylglycerol:prolipoprotein diacylglycerol transferase